MQDGEGSASEGEWEEFSCRVKDSSVRWYLTKALFVSHLAHRVLFRCIWVSGKDVFWQCRNLEFSPFPSPVTGPPFA